MSHLSRRSLVISAAALPALAIPAAAIAAAVSVVAPPLTAAPSSADTMLIELEIKAARLDAQAAQAGDLHTEAEDAMFAWERRNPKPIPRDAVGKDVINASRFEGGVVFGTEKHRLYMDALDEAISDLKAAIAEHQEALKSWKERHRVASANCHFDERKAKYEGLLEEADAFREEAAVIMPDTIDGLRCKARMLSEDDLYSINGALAESIIKKLRGPYESDEARFSSKGERI